MQERNDLMKIFSTLLRILIAGAIFLTNSGIDWPSIIAQTVITYELAVPLWILLFSKRGEPGLETYHPMDSRPPGERLWKFVVCDVSYPVLYFAAGTIIFPFVKDFYASQTLPPAGRLIAMQLLVRGPILVGLCLLLLRLLRLPRVSGALALGAVLTLLSSVALLIPNPYFPDAIRMAHLCEIASSTFVFGAIVGLLWGRPNPAARA